MPLHVMARGEERLLAIALGQTKKNTRRGKLFAG